MFKCSGFNQPLNNWNVGKVTNMSSMFGSQSSLSTLKSPFNQDIGMWDTSNVTDMSSMFFGSFFNQDLSSWNAGKVTNMNYMFSNSALSNLNYDKFIISCAKQTTLNSVFFTNQTGRQYFHSEEARTFLVANRSWTFSSDSKRTASLFNATLTDLSSNTDIDLQIFLDEAKTLPIHFPSHEFNTGGSSSLIRQVVNTQTYYFTATKGVNEATGTFTVSASDITVEYTLGGVEPSVGTIKIKLDGSFTEKQLKLKIEGIFTNVTIQ
jgi:surface protein